MFKSIVDAIVSHAKNTPKKLCIVDDMYEYTYQNIWNNIRNIASYYKNVGLRKGDCVVVECTQNARFLICGLACQLSGTIFVPVEYRSVLERCREIIDDVDAKLLICESDYDVNVKRIRMSTLFGNLKNTEKTCDTQEIVSEDVAEILYTTGTTGNPKGIVITNLNNVAVAENVVEGTCMLKDSVELIPLPLSHSHGLRSCYANFINGSTIILFDGVTKVREIFEYIEKYHITAMDLSPSAAKVLLKLSKGNFSKYREQIDFIQIGTAMLDEDIKNELCNTFDNSRLYNFYGSTESGRSCILDFNSEKGKAGCIGMPAKHAKFIITDKKRNQIQSSADHMGLIAIAGAMNMQGYWRDEKATKEIMHNGYIYTNDLGYIDSTGNIYMIGRADDVINYKGIKISPEEIEICALKYEEVLDCACVPIADKICGQVPKLFVVVRDENSFDKKEYLNFLNTLLNDVRIPRQIEIIDKIPRTANGKLQRKKLVDMG